MSRQVRLHPEAESELADAIRWYRREGFELAVNFAEAVEQGLAAIREHPKRYPLVLGHTRRLLVRRFPYGIVYVIRPADLKVVAIYHLSRDPPGWQNRE